ncbi:MAG TPA: protoporphyrinogen oxidase, partial [Bacteroidota bacterium]
MKKRPSVVIIGGGISGLATAWWLHKASFDVVVLEREQELGGTMQTIHDRGWLIESGPNSALETTPLFKTLTADTGLAGEVVYANEIGNNRYILRGGKLHALPMSPGAFLKSHLWSTGGKLRLLKEPFIGRADHEETIARFVERRLGREFLDYAINPFVAGVYAGNPEELSVRAAFPKLYALEERYGGLIKGQIRGRSERGKRAEKSKDRARMFAFSRGMQTFPQALGKALAKRVFTGTTVQRISENRNTGSARFTVTGTRKHRNVMYRADAVISAIPSYSAAQLLSRIDAPLSES